jgi:hypothetical protein
MKAGVRKAPLADLALFAMLIFFSSQDALNFNRCNCPEVYR